MAASPIYAGTPRAALAQVTGAAGTKADLAAGGASGSRFSSTTATCTGNSSAGLLKFYLSDGTNDRVVLEATVSAVTVSATVAAASVVVNWTDYYKDGLIVPSGYKLKAACSIGNTYDCATVGGDF
jgi:hypothetical protein